MRLEKLLICIFFPFTLKAQFIIKGNVKNIAAENLQHVTVSLNDNISKAVITYAVTDAVGNYEIEASRDTGVFLRVSYVGYKTEEKKIKNISNPYNFKLADANFSLPEVMIKSRPLIRQNGDTLNYNASQFSKIQDRTIGDVIKSLPGISVNPQGQISYNGKPINKFYIDGDDILGDKYAIASNSIPNNVVDVIQVLENHQPIKMLENKVFDDNTALNIKLKNSSKLRLFGSGSAGAGVPFYSGDIRINTLAFLKKIKVINTYSFNNIGIDLSSEILSQNTNVPWQQQLSNKLQPVLSFTGLPRPIIPDKYFFNNQSHLISLNSFLPISKVKSMKFNINWLPSLNTNITKVSNTYYLQNDTIKQFENQTNRIRNNNFSFSTTYLINANKYYFQNQFQFETLLTKGVSNIDNEIKSFQQSLNGKNKGFTNALTLKKIFARNYIFETSISTNYNNFPEKLNAAFGAYPWLLNSNIDYLQTAQTTKTNRLTNNLDISISKIINKFLIKINEAFLIETENTKSDISLNQLNGSNKNADSVFVNNFNWQLQKNILTPSLGYSSNKVQISILLPIVLRKINYADFIRSKDTSLTRLSFHPNAKITFDLNKYAKISLSYKRETDYTNSLDLIQGGILRNYRNLSTNNLNIEFSNSNSFSAAYSYRNVLKIKFFNAALIYSTNYNPTIANQNFNLGLIETNQRYFDNNTSRILLLTTVSKYFFKLKGTIKTGYSGTMLTYNQIQNNIVNSLRGVSHNLNASFSAKPFWNFNYELSFNYTTSASKNLSTNSNIGGNFNLLNTQLETVLNIRENLFIQLLANHSFQKSNNNNNSYLLADLKLSYTIPKTKTDIGFKVINIFNEKVYKISNVDGVVISTNEYWLRPSTLLLFASFRF